jgi:Tfp pilus assembly protein PilF
MKTRLLRIHFFLLVCLWPLSGMPQAVGPISTADNNLYRMAQTVWLVTGKIRTVHGEPVRGAMVTVEPLNGTGSRNLATDPRGEFNTQYELLGAQDTEFSVIFTVKKKGFQTAHGYINFGRSGKAWAISLTLREQQDEDPGLLSSADLIAELAPKLRQLGPGDGLGAKSEKDYTRGVAEFLDRRSPERAVPLLAKVLGNNPSCLGCQTMLGLAELSWSDWDDAKNSFRESVNAILANGKMGRPEPLVAYGTWISWEHDPEKAEPYFGEALKFAPQDAMALQELGRSLLPQQKFELATDTLKRAIAAGAGREARLLYVEALLGAGRSDEAAAEMNRYLNGQDVKKMSLRVRQVWANVQNQEKVQALYAKTKPPKGQEQVDFLGHPPADLIRGLEPAKDQEQLSSILDGVGARILEMINNFPNTSSREAIHQEKLGRKGGVSGTQNQEFRYLCLVPRETWGPGFIEYRADFDGNPALPKGLSEGFMLTSGFASAGLIFHPAYRSESTFHYLGRQKINGQNTFAVAFAQIPGKSHLFGSFQKGLTSETTFSQGLAWINPDTYQIIRLHTDLLAPLPEFRLAKETLNIDFKEVHFSHLKEAFWLPEKVTLTLDWDGKLLRNQHEYSDFKIFNVATSEKIGKPKESAESSQEAPEPAVTP